MSFLPPDASLVEILEDCVSAYRERGIGLSPRNLALLAAWLQQGIPPEVIARGIALYAEQARWDRTPGQPLFFSVAACQWHVRQAWDQQRYVEAGRGRTEEG